jgi:large subunit ribosomal protein L13e
MVKHNNVIPNQHFKKKWQFRVRTWFNQPARKVRRRSARAAKAAAAFPRPAAGSLRPVVHGQTTRYNAKTRLGRGFTPAELKEAGIPVGLAPTIGIAVDKRRVNRSLEGKQENVARLKAYRASLVLFPTKAKAAPKAGETARGEAVEQYSAKVVLPIARSKPELETAAVTAEMKAAKAYATIRMERMNRRMAGIREKRAREAAAEEKKE